MDKYGDFSREKCTIFRLLESARVNSLAYIVLDWRAKRRPIGKWAWGSAIFISGKEGKTQQVPLYSNHRNTISHQKLCARTWNRDDSELWSVALRTARLDIFPILEREPRAAPVGSAIVDPRYGLTIVFPIALESESAGHHLETSFTRSACLLLCISRHTRSLPSSGSTRPLYLPL